MSKATQLMLSRSDLAALMAPRDYFAAAEDAFRALAENRGSAAAPMHMETARGVFHAKGGAYQNQRGYITLKLNANFPGNPERTGLPTIQGAILLCDADNGALLCILDSAEITLRRTAAASALAARHLANANARTLLLCGCGVQGLAHVEALADLFRLESVLCWDQRTDKADALAARIRTGLSLNVQTVADLGAARSAQIIATMRSRARPGARRTERNCHRRQTWTQAWRGDLGVRFNRTRGAGRRRGSDRLRARYSDRTGLKMRPA